MLPGTFIKGGTELLAAPLTQIINISIITSTFPDSCKITNLWELFKKGSKTDPKNYRPISLLPLLSTTFERVVHLQTEQFINENNILYKKQPGPLHSTQSCLPHLIIMGGCDNVCHTGMILIDLQKAFDTINHYLLLEKLSLMNFSNTTICWFKSYLLNITLLVNFESSFSEPADLKCGMTQGSILGPLLFLLYKNDSPQAVNDCDIRLYADDTCISYKHKIVNQLKVN